MRQLVTRRRALQLLGVGFLSATGLMGYTTMIEPHWAQVIRVPLPIEGLPEALVGRRVLQISDLHVGRIVDSGFLIRALESATALEPDLICITGDIAETKWPESIGEAVRVLRHLPAAPLGTIAILGNHDYGRHWSSILDADRLADAVSQLGITVLRNQATTVAGLQVIGMDDFWTPRFDGRGAMALRDPARPALVLCHNPEVCDQDVWGDYRGWILSGHTHGGQCKPPFLPPPLIPVANRRYTRGAFDLDGGRSLYINAGLGYLKRIRFNVRPELTLFELQRA